MSIHELPNETFQLVLKNVVSLATTMMTIETRDALRNLCLVSRHFCCMAQPLLYETYAQGDSRPFVPSLDHKAGRLAAQYHLRTLIERPDLAARVFYITLEFLVHDQVSAAPQTAVQGTPPKSLATSFQHAASCIDTEKILHSWNLALCRGSEDAEIALLLALTPNLKSLTIRISSLSAYKSLSESCTGSFIREATLPCSYPRGGVHTFKSLTDFTLEQLNSRAEQAVNTNYSSLEGDDFLGNILKLPSLQRFCSIRMRGPHDVNRLSTLVGSPGSSKVNQIQLTGIGISSEGLKTLLGCSQRLNTFILSVSRFKGLNPFVSWPSVSEALEQHRNSLQDLSLDFKNCQQDRALSMDQGAPIGSLVALSALHNLTLSQEALCGIPCRQLNAKDILPGSLRRLVLTEYSNRILGFLESLLCNLAHFPNLCVLEVRRKTIVDKDWDPMSEQEYSRIFEVEKGLSHLGLTTLRFEQRVVTL